MWPNTPGQQDGFMIPGQFFEHGPRRGHPVDHDADNGPIESGTLRQPERFFAQGINLVPDSPSYFTQVNRL